VIEMPMVEFTIPPYDFSSCFSSYCANWGPSASLHSL